MGHDIIRCDFCGEDVMECRNSWECSCGAICGTTTSYKWILPSKRDKEIKPKIIEESDIDFDIHPIMLI